MDEANKPTVKKRVLLAEDDKFISLAYKDGLTRAGYEVVQATDGNIALEKMRAEKFDIILLDVIMPEKNGFDVLTELKKDNLQENVPVIVLSNLGQDSDIKKGKELGASDYMIKSNVSMKEVIKKIENLTN